MLDQGYRVILIDLRGNGKSDHPHREQAYARDAESRDIPGLMDFLKIKRYDLIGYSRGSIIADRVLEFLKSRPLICFYNRSAGIFRHFIKHHYFC